MTIANADLPAYSEDLLVLTEASRESVIKDAKALAACVCKPGGCYDERTLVVSGPAGSGKTWLSLHLHHSILKSAGDAEMRSLLLMFDPPRVPLRRPDVSSEWIAEETLSVMSREKAERTAMMIVLWLADRLGLSRPEETTLKAVRTVFENEAEAAATRKPLALVLDSVFETSWELLEILEETCLAILGASTRVMFVITGRGKPYPWKSPYLRNLILSHELSEFSADLVKEQLKRAGFQDGFLAGIIPAVMRFGGGNPLNNIVIARALQRKAIDTLDEADLLQAMLDWQLVSVRQNPPKDRAYDGVLEDLQALAVLRPNFSTDEEMRAVLAARRGLTSIGLPEVHAARDRLTRYNLLRWKTETKGWEVDPSIRSAAEQLLKAKDAPKWYELHERMCALYTGWAAKYAQYPQLSKRYSDGAEHHANQLKSLQVSNYSKLGQHSTEVSS
jgi:hypothetical protein